MSAGVVRGLRIGIVLACLGALAASDAQTTIQLKEAKLKGIDGTKEILDWAPTSAKAGVAVMCDDDLEQECGPGIALLKPTGTSKPFQYLGHDDARAALAWPGGGYAARHLAGRAKPTGVVVVVARNDDGLVLYTGQVKSKGKLKGKLRQQAVLHETPASGRLYEPRVRAAMVGDRVGVVVAFRISGVFEEQVLFAELDGKGAMLGDPVELTFSGTARAITITPLDLVGDGDAWHVLASHDEDYTNDNPEGPGRLLGWTLPAGSARARMAALTIAATPVPAGGRAVRYRGSFVRDHEPLTVFYDEIIRWETDVARQRGVAVSDSSRYLDGFGDNARRARTPVPVEAWSKIAQIWNTSANSIPTVDERTSAAIARGNDHVFAIGRDATRTVSMQASWLEPQQEYSIYSLDPDTGQTQLLGRTVRSERTGQFVPILIRRFGSKTTILFNFDDEFAYIDRVLLTTF